LSRRIAGLSTAYYAQKTARESGLDVDITLVESEDRLGGKILTDTPDGFVIEAGRIRSSPRSLTPCS